MGFLIIEGGWHPQVDGTARLQVNIFRQKPIFPYMAGVRSILFVVLINQTSSLSGDGFYQVINVVFIT